MARPWQERWWSALGGNVRPTWSERPAVSEKRIVAVLGRLGERRPLIAGVVYGVLAGVLMLPAFGLLALPTLLLGLPELFCALLAIGTSIVTVGFGVSMYAYHWMTAQAGPSSD